MLNTYRQVFHAPCCVNSRQVEYTLEIEAQRTIMVEEIQAAVVEAAALEKPYHETMADWLYERFGGRQTMTAFHHGTEITTRRGRLEA